jgi:glycosyltransferase involved in cell wall biosynthesis
MKIALVCDSMSAFGGAERVIEQILRLYPSADLYTVLDAVPRGQRQFLQGCTIQTSFLQKLPWIERYYRKLLPLWPIAVEQLNIMAYDLIISSHHSVAYGVLTRPGQVHVSYVHSPMRYAWDGQHEYLHEANLDHGLKGLLARRILHKARMWDHAAAQRPDAIIANSYFIAERMWKLHKRRATVIYPPVNTDGFRRDIDRTGYYLSVGRLVPYKRVDLLVRAFATMPHRRLKIVGEGPEAQRIAALAPPNVEVLGFQCDGAVRDLLSGASAYLFAGTEDFGIAAVEAQAAGTPVIAYRRGGLLETIVAPDAPDPTGLFFEEQTVEAVVAAVEAFEQNACRFSAKSCIANAERFSERRFRDELAAFIDSAMSADRERAWHQPKLARHFAREPAAAMSVTTPTGV